MAACMPEEFLLCCFLPQEIVLLTKHVHSRWLRA